MHSWLETGRASCEAIINDASAPEAAVIARAKSGDPEAISWLYERYAPLVRRYVASRVGDAQLAEDICNDVFVKVLESLGRYEDRGWPFSAWLYRIAYARSMDIMRQSRRRPSVPLDDGIIGDSEPLDETIMMRMAHHEIQQIMSVLTNDQRMVLRLRFTEDRSLAEVAASLGRTIGSVKALQHRGLTRLAEELAGQTGHTFALR